MNDQQDLGTKENGGTAARFAQRSEEVIELLMALEADLLRIAGALPEVPDDQPELREPVLRLRSTLESAVKDDLRLCLDSFKEAVAMTWALVAASEEAAESTS